MPKESPPWESRSNGELESAVKAGKGMIRSAKSVLENDSNTQVDKETSTLSVVTDVRGRCQEQASCWPRRSHS